MNSRRRLLPSVLRGAVLMMLAAFPAAAADGIDGAAHAFRGDVLIVRGTKVLLFGVTAPGNEPCLLETGSTPCSDAAKAGLAALVEEAPVACSFVRKIGHGSYQGHCQRPDGSDIGLTLLRQGWVRADAEASTAYRAAEAEAKAERRGLWAQAPD